MTRAERSAMIKRVWDGQPREIPDEDAHVASGFGRSQVVFYSEDQSRDDHGRWGEGGGSAESGAPLTGEAADAAVPQNGDYDIMRTYLGSAGYGVNAQLRGDTSSRDYDPNKKIENDAVTARMDAAFAAAPPLEQAVQVSRGIGGAAKVFGPGNLTGTAFTDHGFTSTATTESAAKFFTLHQSDSAMVRITVPAGATALRVGDDSEHEVLLPRGTSFRIVSDEATPGEVYSRLIKMEVQP